MLAADADLEVGPGGPAAFGTDLDQLADTGAGAMGMRALATTRVCSTTLRSPPTGSRPIDQTPWSGDHEEVKKAIGAKPKSALEKEFADYLVAGN